MMETALTPSWAIQGRHDTVCKGIGEGQLPGYKIFRLWRFSKKQVDEAVKQDRVSNVIVEKGCEK